MIPGHYERAADLAEQATTIKSRIGIAEPELADLAELELTIALAQVHATLAVADELRGQASDVRGVDL